MIQSLSPSQRAEELRLPELAAYPILKSSQLMLRLHICPFPPPISFSLRKLTIVCRPMQIKVTTRHFAAKHWMLARWKGWLFVGSWLIKEMPIKRPSSWSETQKEPKLSDSPKQDSAWLSKDIQHLHGKTAEPGELTVPHWPTEGTGMARQGGGRTNFSHILPFSRSHSEEEKPPQVGFCIFIHTKLVCITGLKSYTSPVFTMWL